MSATTPVQQSAQRRESTSCRGSLRIIPQIIAAACVLGATHLATAADLRRGPYLQAQRTDGITIRWRTDDSVRDSALVRYGTRFDQLDQIVAAAPVHQHFPGTIDWAATIDGLQPGTRYYYSVEADQATLAGADERHFFRTAPAAGQKGPLRFWLLGDSGENRPRRGDIETAKARPISAALSVRNGFRRFQKNAPADAIILLGDNAYAYGTDAEYQSSFFQVYADELARTPLWPCVGNHDMDDAYRYLFSVNSEGKAGGVPSRNPYYYSVDIANVHVVVLDPWTQWLQVTSDVDHVPWQKQLAWFKQDLAATRQQWIVIVNHFPVYCDGNYNSDDNAPLVKLREMLVPLVEEYGADLFVAGHDHTYQRSFLIDGHHGPSGTFDPAIHVKAQGDGRKEPLVKKRGAHGGTMYIVSGTAGGTRPDGRFAHPAMIPFPHEGGHRKGIAIPGSLVLEVDGLVLRGWQVGTEGQVLDQFTIRKHD